MTSSAVHLEPGRRAVSRVAAFFDMDKTLIAENSGSIYLKVRYQRGEVDTRELLRGLGDYLRYKAGVLDLQSWARAAMLEFAGRTEEDLAAEAEQIFEQQIEQLIYPEAAALVQDHLASGHVVAIVSGATRYAVEPIARHLGVEHMLFTALEVEQGRLTGRVIEPICFEEGKVYWLRHFIDHHRIDLARSYFYTDSVTDLPLLDLVGHPVVVNPDPRLYRTAVRRRWPVRIFRKPGAAPAATAG
ncbi:MAG: HAD-IB family hydrolase [Myxococcota bacterium]|nr:HAD-IB family hydrolase [Myxococcota bacterium]